LVYFIEAEILMFNTGMCMHFLAVHYIHPKKLGSPVLGLCFCQHSQRAQEGLISRVQLRPSDIIVSPDILRLL